MQRYAFINTKKRLIKGYWIQQSSFNVTACRECSANLIINLNGTNCIHCGGKGYHSKPSYRYSVSSGNDPKINQWEGTCGRCGHASRAFKRTGQCECAGSLCLKCHGKRCQHCNFKGRMG